ncbi:hypothetical protein Franean1_0719 [Parafrankia sp. EAN1pec]|nr:hypothetical protein Franean1_0719 [Frankia sp. EAN1pec]
MPTPVSRIIPNTRAERGYGSPVQRDTPPASINPPGMVEIQRWTRTEQWEPRRKKRPERRPPGAVHRSTETGRTFPRVPTGRCPAASFTIPSLLG